MDSDRVIKNNIENYIENELLTTIKKEVQEFILTNERDIEASIYHHLRLYLKKLKSSSLRLATNFTVSKVKVISRNSSFRQPDIVILKQIQNPRPIIAIELKQNLKSNHQLEKEIKKDIKKLERFRKLDIIETGYSIFITNDSYSTASELEKRSKKLIKDKKIKVLIINPIEDYLEDTSKVKEYFSQLNTFKEYNHQKEKVIKRKRRQAAYDASEALGKKKRIEKAKKAARTRKKNVQKKNKKLHK